MKDSDRADLSARACGVVIDSDGFGCCGGVDADGVEDAAAGFDSGRGLACDVGVFEGKNCLLRSPESLCLNFGPKPRAMMTMAQTHQRYAIRFIFGSF